MNPFMLTLKDYTHLLSSNDMVSDEPCEATEVPASELRIEWESSGTVSVTNLLFVFYVVVYRSILLRMLRMPIFLRIVRCFQIVSIPLSQCVVFGSY